MAASHALTNDAKVLTFHKNAYVFDGLSIALGVEGAAKLPNLTAGLFARGYKETDVSAMMGGNWLRCIENFCG